MKKFLCPIFVAIMSSEALAGSYAIKLRGFGFNRADCDGDLALVAEAFGVGADVEILSAGCAAPEIGENAPSGIFTYASPTRIATSSSDVRQSSRVDGHYDSFASCESARQSEWGIFARVTGLSPYVSYCYQANSVGAPRYRVRIDAVGTSQTKKQSISASWMHRLDDERKLVGDVQNLVTSVGGEVIAATVDRDMASIFIMSRSSTCMRRRCCIGSHWNIAKQASLRWRSNGTNSRLQALFSARMRMAILVNLYRCIFQTMS